ncbi:short chain dehydrogenase domain-containing protein [Sarocladium implicatum]|nr:short chain dehydrogenase domain-containing protein [Sarocladium implicatum]
MSAGLEQRANWEAGLGNFQKQIFQKVPPIPAGLSFKGQTAIITGSSTGIGLESARQFLDKRLSTLIMGVRSAKKGDEAAAQLRAQYPDADIQVWIVNMESFQSVRDFAHKCESLDRIDIVILNAACGKGAFERVSEDKHRETTLQVNYLATVLLTLLLAPILAKKRADLDSPARLTLVGSDAAHQAGLERSPTGVLDSVDREEKFDGMQAYSQTKLLLLMFVVKLAEVIDPKAVVLNVVNPGAVKGTQLLREGKGLSPLRVVLFFIYAIAGRTVSDGARQYMIATSVMGKETHGSFVDFAVRPWSPIMYTERGRALIDDVWSETLTELGVDDVRQTLGAAAL